MIPCLKDNIDFALEKYGEHSKEHLDAFDPDEPLMVCMRPDGHEGDCEFVAGDKVQIRFKKQH